jgi:tetratricopeptide (TPR) repeat protein
VSVILLAGIVACVWICWSAFRTNGALGFPLDDPWIHLQFARTLREVGSFSYFGHEMVTSGSTSPLYTLLLAAGFLLTSDEMVLSYVLGIAFFAAGAFVLSRVGKGLFTRQPVLIAASVALFMLEPRLQWAALSGMETTLFIFLLLLTWHLYRIRSPRWLGLTAGLLLWTRPEAILFFLVLAIDAAYHAKWARRERPQKGSHPGSQPDYRWLSSALVVAGLICAGYAVFNFALSGSLLPNTYAAKTRYYGSGGTGFPAEVFQYLTAGHMPVLAILVAIALIDVFRRIATRARQEYLVPVLWCAGLFAAYWQQLPFLYQEGRYLMPLLPFVILLGVRGTGVLLTEGERIIASLRSVYVSTAVTAGISLLLVTLFVVAGWEKSGSYADYCKYISDRQVRTALWLRDNLPQDAVIGTHDIGAIAFYSGRRVVDMVGLVSPDMIENIGSFEGLAGFLRRHHVTHLAVLRNWFEVANQNPLFQTDEQTPEIMEVLAFDPHRTRFIPQNASRLTAQGSLLLATGQVHRAGPMLEASLRFDPRSARTHSAMALAYLIIGKTAEAERGINAALGLQPDSWEARRALGQLMAMRNNPDSAIAVYKKILQEDSTYAPPYRELSQLYLTLLRDTASATAYLGRYAALTFATPSPRRP